MREGWVAILAAMGLGSAVATAQVRPPAAYTGTATGVVFEDRNGNGRRDPGEPGIAGVRVSNQRDVTRTDRQGRWRLGTTNDTIFFVVKPRGYRVPVDADNIPRFYYVHKPGGSPASRFPGVAPTGPLPASIDFPLRRQREPDRFSALFFGDTQPRDLREVDYIARSVVEPLIGRENDKAFGVTLGDIVFDDLSVLEPLAKTIGLIGIPWYYVLGNHDINFDAPDDEHSDETWARVFGPNYYSFEHGPVHFVSLDNVVWFGAGNVPEGRGRYRAGLGDTQLNWLREDLKFVPKDKLVVLMMHIPMTEIEDRQKLYDLLADRPYTLSVSAHTHMQEHRFITEADGWRRREPHHHVINVTTCGSWWSGAPDALGIPLTTMRDGAPHGYAVFTFDGREYRIEYRAAGRDANYQMNIYAPDVARRGQAPGPLYVNVFGGSARSTVEYRVGNGPWLAMTRVAEADPAYQAAFQRDQNLARPYRPLPVPQASTHLWKAELPALSTLGQVPIYVRTRDMFGQTYLTTRSIRVQ
jgi:hypothetical protein